MMRNVLILGCGRSGTSLVAGSLAGAGYFMGENLSGPQPANPKGYFESVDINLLNEEILALAPHVPVRRRPFRHGMPPKALTVLNHFWLARVPLRSPLRMDGSVPGRIRALTARRPFCFKDPRFCYALPAWRPYLQDCVFVCVFRAPNTTAESMLKDVASSPFYSNLWLTYRQALKIWECMYTHVLEQHRHEGRWLFLHYDQLFTREGMNRLEDATEARVDPGFADPALRRTRPTRRITATARRMYDELCERAGLRAERRGRDAGAAAAA